MSSGATAADLLSHPAVTHVLGVAPRIPTAVWDLELAPVSELRTLLVHRQIKELTLFDSDLEEVRRSTAKGRVEAGLTVNVPISDAAKYAEMMSWFGTSPTGGSAGPHFKFELNMLTGTPSNIRLHLSLATGEAPIEVSGDQVTRTFMEVWRRLQERNEELPTDRLEDLRHPNRPNS